MNPKILIAIGVIGAAFIIIGMSVLFGALPKIVQDKVNEQMVLDENNTDIYDMFKSLPVPLQFRIWAFEADVSTFDGQHINTITYKKRGPYVYNEQRNKSFIEFSSDGNNVSYTLDKYYTFNKDESCPGCSKDDKINFFNPLFAMEQANLDSFIEANKKDPETLRMFESLIYNFDTIDDLLITGNSNLGQSILASKDFNTFIVDTGKSDIKQLEQVLSYADNSEITGVWPNNDDGSTSRCNKLIGTDATQYAPGLTGDETIWAFETLLCYSLYAKHGILPDRDVKDIPTYRYTIMKENFLETLENSCFCLEDDIKQCTSGMLNLKKCGAAIGFEFLASPAYFFEAPEHLKWTGLDKIVNIDDITEENCGTFFDIEPQTGIVLNAEKKLMLNIKVRPNAVPALKDLATDKYFNYQVSPFLYIEEAGGIDDENAKKLKDKLYPKKVATAALIIMIVVGVLLICVSVFLYFRQL
ncbi:hypothetical protein DERP_005920 [Dermatophagoides pteronyssinus]|uniref:Lysosome membrane protein 2-like n=1 Tax=Dermatophagoides pteronyssinus TaxID=6956 RepID=A0ABQ8JRT8_DERPT|nr:hypothetical protein DERP_005920 [Dermatophagoides pteronyssinus]